MMKQTMNNLVFEHEKKIIAVYEAFIGLCDCGGAEAYTQPPVKIKKAIKELDIESEYFGLDEDLNFYELKVDIDEKIEKEVKVPKITPYYLYAAKKEIKRLEEKGYDVSFSVDPSVKADTKTADLFSVGKLLRYYDEGIDLDEWEIKKGLGGSLYAVIDDKKVLLPRGERMLKEAEKYIKMAKTVSVLKEISDIVESN
jgi:hypothetical protein